MLADAVGSLDAYKPFIPMTGWGNEVEKYVDTVVAESRITLDTGLFSQNIIILPFEVTANLGEAEFVNQSSFTVSVDRYCTSPRCRFGRQSQGCRQW